MSFLELFDAERRTSLYVHIPFCMSKCHYCDFYSFSADDLYINNYFKRLTSEIKRAVEYFNKPFYTVYIGGGTPSLLSLEQIEKLYFIICKYGEPEEFTLEVNPENFNYYYKDLLSKYKIRISMGVQTFNSFICKKIGRNASIKCTFKSVYFLNELAGEIGIRASCDFLCCIRGTSLEPLSDVEEMTERYTNINHLSIYALTPSDTAPLFTKRKYKVLTEKTQANILKETWSFLKYKGFRHYEVSNFAKNDDLSKHNMVYWDYEQFIGIGTAASGTAFKDGKVYRITGKKDTGAYIYNEDLTEYEIEEISREQQVEEIIMLGCRTDKGVNLKRLRDDYGIKITSAPLNYKIEDDYLKPDGDLGYLSTDRAVLELVSKYC